MSDKQTIATNKDGDRPVTWKRHGGSHVIQYGAHTESFACSLAAAREFAECIHHALECAGQLDEPLPHFLQQQNA